MRLGGEKEPGTLVPGTEVSLEHWPRGGEGRIVRNKVKSRGRDLLGRGGVSSEDRGRQRREPGSATI